MKTYDINDLEKIIKDNFANEDIDINALSHRIKHSVKIGKKQIENGEYMSLEQSKKLIDEKFFKNI